MLLATPSASSSSTLVWSSRTAAAVLELQTRVEELLADGVARSIDDLAQALGENSEESMFMTLRHLVGNNRGYAADGDWAEPITLRFRKS